ncbi:MAG: putative rane protein [Myxococcaceae bacterium]|nr:putative rane protein [Myxococcaceae bacterium]
MTHLAQPTRPAASIWIWAFGYFAAYAPYSALTKALSDGALGEKLSGNAILPVSTFTSLVGMIAFMLISGWWRLASTTEVFGLKVPTPTRWTLLSGICTAAIITTTTLAYTFSGVSIVLMMLLMRGGVLIIAPIVDAISGRKVQWHNWVALGLTFASLLVAASNWDNLALTITAFVDVVAYVASYFVRLRFMSRLAKSDSPDATKKYFVEEQMVATPVAFGAMGVLALIGQGRVMEEIRTGFTHVPFTSAVWIVVLIGLFSQGTGVFGALVLLDKRSNSFTVPVNRASSVLAGVLATLILTLWLSRPPIASRELLGAALVTLAIAVLSAPGILKARALASVSRG